MSTDTATKKLFAAIDKLEKKLTRLDELEARLAKLDSNGTLDEIKADMKKVAANSQLVVIQVEEHGCLLAMFEKSLTRLNLCCPLIQSAETNEFEKAGCAKKP